MCEIKNDQWETPRIFQWVNISQSAKKTSWHEKKKPKTLLIYKQVLTLQKNLLKYASNNKKQKI